jgi:hypothetical protein
MLPLRKNHLLSEHAVFAPKADATGWSGYLNAASKVLAIWTSILP